MVFKNSLNLINNLQQIKSPPITSPNLSDMRDNFEKILTEIVLDPKNIGSSSKDNALVLLLAIGIYSNNITHVNTALDNGVNPNVNLDQHSISETLKPFKYT